MSKRNIALPPETELHLEDKAMKVAAQYFGSELLPRMGIEGRVVGIAPTEQIHLDARQFMEDFNYIMEDGTWTHLEFESDSITVKDLHRFRIYEAYISYTYDVEVTTYVICTSKVKRIKSELREGINTYRVKVIRMKDRDGDILIGQLEEKQKEGRKLERAELAELILTPLMGGESSQKERIKRSMQVLQNESSEMNKEDVQRMQSVLYAFAEKFLEQKELDEIKEGMAMTRLGRMIMEDGIQKGKAEGELSKLISLVRKKLEKGLSAEEIADVLEEDVNRIQPIITAIQKNSEAEDEFIVSMLM